MDIAEALDYVISNKQSLSPFLLERLRAAFAIPATPAQATPQAPQIPQIPTSVEAAALDLVAEARENLELAKALRGEFFANGRLLRGEDDDGNPVFSVKEAKDALQAVDKVIATAARHLDTMHNVSRVMAIEKAAKESMALMAPEQARRFVERYEQLAKEMN